MKHDYYPLLRWTHVAVIMACMISHEPITVHATSSSFPFELVASEDTHVRKDKPSREYGTLTRFDTKSRQDLGDIRYGFVKFDLTAAANLDGPAEFVELRLRPYTKKDRNVNIGVFSVSDSSSSQGSLNWDNKPEAHVLLDEKPYSWGDFVFFDVTDYVYEVLSQGSATDISFMLQSLSEADVTKFYSSEYTDNPTWQPTLEFVAPPPTPTFVPPYDVVKFQSALSGCRLQCPTTSNAVVSNGEFEGYATQYFQLVGSDSDQELMQIAMAGQGNRCELRHNTEWPSTTPSVLRSMFARLQFEQPANDGTTSFTFLQIHTKDFKGNPKGPLLRIHWRRQKDVYEDYVWAAFRVSLNPKEVDFIPLFARPTGLFEIELRVSESTLTILKNDEALPGFDEYDLSYWDSIETNYFTAGVHPHTIATDDTITVQFDELTINV